MHSSEVGPASLMAAAARLRSGPPAGAQHTSQISSATARLLEQLAAGLAYDDPLPSYVRRAALALAARLLAADQPGLRPGPGADSRADPQCARRASELPAPRSWAQPPVIAASSGLGSR